MKHHLDHSKKQEVINLYQSSEYQKALELAIRILSDNPENDFIYQIMGKIYFSLSKIKKSIFYFKKAIRLDPFCFQNYNSIAIAYSEIGNETKAIEYLKKALTNIGQNAHAHFIIGLMYTKKNSLVNALDSFTTSISIKPYYPEAFNEIGKAFYNLFEYEKSIISLSRCIKQKWSFDEAHHNLGNSFRAIGNYVKAISSYKTAIEINPNRIDSRHCIGLTLYEINDYSNGKEYFHQILTENPNDNFAKRNFAIGLMKQGYLLEAIKYFEEVSLKLPYCTMCQSCLLELSAFKKNINIKTVYGKFTDIIDVEPKASIEPSKNIVALLGFGRSGSLFLHSLFDGHPEISTLPGYFFKGWFNEKTWPLIKPDFQEANWRETLAEKICNYFEPQFDASSKKNVIGRPNDHTEWFAQNLGFTQLGDEQSEILQLDQDTFKKCFINLLQSYDTINNKDCFEFIHQAFDKAYRNPETNINKLDKPIFYHIHNPSYFERANFNYHYPNAKSLFIVRHPIQMLESWIMYDLKQLPTLLEKGSSFENNYELTKVLQASNKIPYALQYFLNPLNVLGSVKGVKLEDIKNNPKITLGKITQWIGIQNDESLYKSEFVGKKFSRPSENFNNISGFDTSSIDVPLGRVFGEKDLKILETLFWPFMNLYQYTQMSEEDFLQNMKIIKPWLTKPFEFEKNLHRKLPNDTPKLEDIASLQSCRRYLNKIWEILEKDKSYPYLIEPLT